FSQQRGLAPDGRCKSFAEAADGVAFAEGVGALVLERLSDAERNGHPVLATIRGSAVNQDGASNGPGAPNGPSQERVIRQALANAGLKPQDVDAIEAHGTGTMLGDPIEAGALLATYGQQREAPLKLGSIKSNIGHTQAAAGVAGVIKAVMAMREGVLPKTLHVDSPSSKIDWEAGDIELLTEAQEWAPNGRPRRAGVSSFGASGTNAHLILEEAPARPEEKAEKEQKPPPLGQALPFVLSAKAPQALRQSASRLAAQLKAEPETELVDLSYSLATTRAALERRAAVVAGDREQLLSGLSALSQGKGAANLITGAAKAEQRPVFLFPGQGAQWLGMGLSLAEASAPFAAALDACEQALEPFVDWSLREVLAAEQGAWLDRLEVVQPALFALMVSLARLWQACGVEPAAVVGHSQGEIAAAHIAGGLSLDDAARIVALRAQAMAKLAGKGAMASVSLPEAELAPLLEPYSEKVSLAALNGPASLILSGETEPLDELIAGCEAKGIRAQRIAVDYAAHSAQIEGLKEELLEAFAPISPQSSQVPMRSTLTGEPIDTAELGPSYWYRNLREPVRLEPVIRALLAKGHRTLIELGPHPVLGFAVQETIEEALESSEAANVIGSLRREEGAERFALSLAQAQAAGAKVEWSAFFDGTGAKAIPLPTYPFQRKRYWLEP
ncbi:MAG TPA: type I polyketide synthase, partial [Hyphomicrobiaceae bacterium]